MQLRVVCSYVPWAPGDRDWGYDHWKPLKQFWTFLLPYHTTLCPDRRDLCCGRILHSMALCWLHCRNPDAPSLSFVKRGRCYLCWIEFEHLLGPMLKPCCTIANFIHTARYDTVLGPCCCSKLLSNCPIQLLFWIFIKLNHIVGFQSNSNLNYFVQGHHL